MRVSTLTLFNIARTAMRNGGAEIAKTQEQMAAGKRILSPSDDPVAATRILQLRDQLGRTEQYMSNITIAENNLALEETTLDGVNTVIQRLQELAVAAGNTATLTPTEYDAIATEVDSRIGELKDLMNARNSAGDYIFAGYRSGEAPFEGDVLSGFHYRGDQGQLQLQIGDTARVMAGDNGFHAFVNIPASGGSVRAQPSPANAAHSTASMAAIITDPAQFGQLGGDDLVVVFNADSDVVPAARNFSIKERGTDRILVEPTVYQPGVPVEVAGLTLSFAGQPLAAEPGQPGDQFIVESAPHQGLLDTAANFVTAMRNYDGEPESRAAFGEALGNTIDNLRAAQNRVSEVSASVGARMNTLETTRDMHLETELISREVLGQLEDLDYAEAATRLSQQTMILQAAQQSFLRVSQLNLFDRMR